MPSPPGVAAAARPLWTLPADEVLELVDTSPTTGLGAREAARRLGVSGPNALRAAPPRPFWRRVLQQFADPLILLLLVAVAVSTAAWVVDGVDAVPAEPLAILVMIVINVSIGAAQEARAAAAVAALDRMAAPHATCLRDGRLRSLPAAEVVPGDVLELAAGDAVAADCRLIDTASLQVAEAALTGESVPVPKGAGTVRREAPLADRTNMAYSGTVVTAGRGRGVVVATGMDTEMGRIARLIDDRPPERTPLQRQMDWLSRRLAQAVVAIAGVVVALVALSSDVTTVGEGLDALLIGVSIAVAAVPEGLPAILTVVLALGVQRMAQDRAIVKRLSSVETLGAATVICTDKTGTLTQNRMTVVAAVTPSGAGDLEDPDLPVEVRGELERMLVAGSIANDATIGAADGGSADVTGDPTEVALLEACRVRGVATDRVNAFERIGELPFSSDRKMMSTLDRLGRRDPDFGEAGDLVLFTKGAPDVVLARCAFERRGGQVVDLEEQRRRFLLSSTERLAGRALRTLAVAYRPVGAHSPVVDPAIEDGLVLLGIVGMIDPPRPEAPRAVRDATRGGVRVVMMTGDHPDTASAIAGQLGIGAADAPAVTGTSLAALDERQLAQVVQRADVFARVDPEHKLRIVRALQGEGQIAGVTGDGVNDAPALRQADIGVAMGVSGTEVSKEAADLILADDNFATIVRAIREGREIFANIRKFLRYLLTSNTGEVLVVLLGVVLAAPLGLAAGDGLAVPLLATQILWINLVTDGPLALALGVDPPVEDHMAEPPRGMDERVVDRRMLTTIGLVGTTIAIVSLVALDLGLSGGPLGGSGDLATARTMAFTTLVLAQVANAFSARSHRQSVAVGLFANPQLWAAAIFTVVAQVLVVHLPGLSDAFDTRPLSAAQWAGCAALAGLVLAVDEVRKLTIRRAAEQPPRSGSQSSR